MVAFALKSMGNSRSAFSISLRPSWELLEWGWRFFQSSNTAHVLRASSVLRDLHLESHRLFVEELRPKVDGDFELTERGLLMLCKTRKALDHEASVAVHAQKLGIGAEVVSAVRAAELDPAVRMDILGGVYFPLDCHLTPQRLMGGLASATARAGVKFLYSTEVTGWRAGQARVEAAVTSEGEIDADEFVLAGGSWSQGLVRGLGLKLPIQPGKGYSLTVSKPRRLPRLCSLLSEARVAVTPMGQTLRVGGTMEFSGFDRTIRRSRVDGIIASVPRYFPDFQESDFQAQPVWSGYRPVSPDGLPYIGRFRKYSNLVAATGHAMIGLSLGPVTGKLVADIVSEENPSVAIEALSPDRFA